MRFLGHCILFHILAIAVSIGSYFGFGAEWGTSGIENAIQSIWGILYLITIAILLVRSYSAPNRLGYVPKLMATGTLGLTVYSTIYLLNSIDFLERQINELDMQNALFTIIILVIVHFGACAIICGFLNNRIKD